MNPKRCKVCGTEFQPVRTFQRTCGWECALESVRMQAQKKQRAEDRETKKRLKSRSDWLKEAQAAVNGYVRARDAGLPCISCGSVPEQKYGGTMDCGHYRSVGSAPQLRFNLKNMACQCVKCNRYLSSNTVEYRKGLINRIGLDEVESLERNNQCAKYSVEYLKRVGRIFRRKQRLLVKRRELRCNYAGEV